NFRILFRFNEKATRVSQLKLPFWTLTVFRVTSKPLFSVSPMLRRNVVNPDMLGIRWFRSRLYVLLWYSSTDPFMRFENNSKSIPKFVLVVVSQPRSGLPIVEV